MEKVSLCLERFDVYYEVVGVTTLLKSRFVTFYIDILNFCLEAIGFYTRGKLSMSPIKLGVLFSRYLSNRRDTWCVNLGILEQAF